MNRYTIRIVFDYNYVKNVKPISEDVKTLKEVQSYKEMIDDSVKQAYVIDNVTNKIVEVWVNKELNKAIKLQP
jgi:hypothetical protein